jgi:hypothetical protein
VRLREQLAHGVRIQGNSSLYPDMKCPPVFRVRHSNFDGFGFSKAAFCMLNGRRTSFLPMHNGMKPPKRYKTGHFMSGAQEVYFSFIV